MLGSNTAANTIRRGRIIASCYPAVIAAAHKLRQRYRTSFLDIDLTVDDLGQYGALKALEYYDRLEASAPNGVLVMTDEALKQTIVGMAMKCIACRIIDVYRKRDYERAANLADALVLEADDSEVRRAETWRRVESLLPYISARQRAVVVSLWRGMDVGEIGSALKVTANVVHKDIAAVRRVAA